MKKNKPGISLSLMIVLFFGCVSHPAANVKELKPKRIACVLVSKNSESLTFTIKANQSLTFIENKLDLPLGVLLHFPETNLNLDRGVYTPQDNEIISSIKAHEIVEDKTTSSRIFFALKIDSPYAITNDDAGIKITFPKTPAISDAKPQKEMAVKKSPAKIIKKRPTTTNYLKKVMATQLKNNIAIEVKADRAIKNYKSFTLRNPDRIVLDIYNLKSLYEEQQIIEVGSTWVKRIRHFGHPDRVRLVIETRMNYLSSYSALPTDSGLLIHVGKIPAYLNQERPTESDDGLESGQVTLTWPE